MWLCEGFMSREWDERTEGKRPVKREDKGSSLYPSYIKEFGTSDLQPITKRINNKSHPFVLGGLGSSGPHCMCKVAYGPSVDGKKLGYVHHKCKRLECKNCFKSILLERVYDITFRVEAYAKVIGDRPAHVTSEIIGVSSAAKLWDMDDYDTFHRRSYRHISAIGGTAGVRLFHPYKIHSNIKQLLKKAGYGIKGNGFWKGVRENALNLAKYEEYYYLAPHDHNIVFPSFLKEHSDNKFFLKKIASLATLEDVIKALFYLISHTGVFKDTEDKDNHPIACFGELHRFKPENFLSNDEITELKTRISETMNYWPDGNGPDDEKESNRDNFIPFHEFNIYSAEKEAWVNAVISSFPCEFITFWSNIIHEYQDKIEDKTIPKDERCLFIEDVYIPDGIKVVEVI